MVYVNVVGGRQEAGYLYSSGCGGLHHSSHDYLLCCVHQKVRDCSILYLSIELTFTAYDIFHKHISV